MLLCVNYTVTVALLSVERIYNGNLVLSGYNLLQLLLVIAACLAVNRWLDYRLNLPAGLRLMRQVLVAGILVLLAGVGPFHWFVLKTDTVIYVLLFSLFSIAAVTGIYWMKGRQDAKRMNEVIYRKDKSHDSPE